MKNAVILCLVFVLVVLFNSCSHVMYIPNTVNSTFLEEKGELELSLYAQPMAYDFHAACALTDKLAIMSNFTYGSAESSSEYKEINKRQFAEFGIGYIKKIRNFNIINCFLGFGKGSAEEQKADKIAATGDYNRMFLQISGGFVKTGNFDLVSGLRICYLDFYNLMDGEAKKKLDTFLIEPAITGRIGWQNLKVQMQCGFSFPLEKNVTDEIDYILPFIFAVGVNYRFHLFH